LTPKCATPAASTLFRCFCASAAPHSSMVTATASAAAQARAGRVRRAPRRAALPTPARRGGAARAPPHAREHPPQWSSLPRGAATAGGIVPRAQRGGACGAARAGAAGAGACAAVRARERADAAGSGPTRQLCNLPRLQSPSVSANSTSARA
jgi:hypothetical protein